MTGKGIIILFYFSLFFLRGETLEIYLLLWFCMWGGGGGVVCLKNWTSLFGPQYRQSSSSTLVPPPSRWVWWRLCKRGTQWAAVPVVQLVQRDMDLFTVSLPLWPLHTAAVVMVIVTLAASLTVVPTAKHIRLISLIGSHYQYWVWMCVCVCVCMCACVCMHVLPICTEGHWNGQHWFRTRLMYVFSLLKGAILHSFKFHI